MSVRAHASLPLNADIPVRARRSFKDVRTGANLTCTIIMMLVEMGLFDKIGE